MRRGQYCEGIPSPWPNSLFSTEGAVHRRLVFQLGGKSHLIHFHVSTVSEKAGRISTAAVFARN